MAETPITLDVLQNGKRSLARYCMRVLVAVFSADTPIRPPEEASSAASLFCMEVKSVEPLASTDIQALTKEIRITVSNNARLSKIILSMRL